jgi:hypothetical protein
LAALTVVGMWSGEGVEVKARGNFSSKMISFKNYPKFIPTLSDSSNLCSVCSHSFVPTYAKEQNLKSYISLCPLTCFGDKLSSSGRLSTKEYIRKHTNFLFI